MQCQNHSLKLQVCTRLISVCGEGVRCVPGDPWRRVEPFTLHQGSKPAGSQGWWSLGLLVQSISGVGDWNKIFFLCPYQCSAYQCISRHSGCQGLFLLQTPYTHTFFTLDRCLICSALKFLSPLLLKSFLMHFFPCFVGKTEAPILLHEAWSGVSSPSLLLKPDRVYFTFGPCATRRYTGCECRGSCLLCVLLWSFFSHPSCCL